MRKASVLIVFAVLVTAGMYLLLPPRTEATFIYYSNHTVSTDTDSPPPAPSSIFHQQEGLRLNLEYIAKQKHYTINSPFTDMRSYTKVSLLLEYLATAPTSEPTAISATIVDDLGQHYQLTGQAEIDPVTNRVWRYTLFFPLLNPQTRNIVISVAIDDMMFELTGATIP